MEIHSQSEEFVQENLEWGDQATSQKQEKGQSQIQREATVKSQVIVVGGKVVRSWSPDHPWMVTKNMRICLGKINMATMLTDQT